MTSDAEHAAFEPVEYTLPAARLRRLSRTGLRRVHPGIWSFRWIWIALYLVLLALFVAFPEAVEGPVRSLARSIGLGFDLVFAVFYFLFLAVFIAGLFVLRSRFRAASESRINFDEQIRLTPLADGVAIAGKTIEYRLKWGGIHQILRDPDGLVLVHGGLFFLIPDSAFRDVSARKRFRNHVISELSDNARQRSAKEIELARQAE